MRIWVQRSKKMIFFIILGTFLRSGSKGVPGWSQGSSQGPSRVKFAPKWVSKWLENLQKPYLQAFWKGFSKTRALSMFPNSSGLFLLVCSYSCRGRFCVTFIQVKSRHSSAWLGGKTYGGCLPDASQMPPRCLPDASQMPLRRLSDASRCFPKKTVWGLALG